MATNGLTCKNLRFFVLSLSVSLLRLSEPFLPHAAALHVPIHPVGARRLENSRDYESETESSEESDDFPMRPMSQSPSLPTIRHNLRPIRVVPATSRAVDRPCPPRLSPSGYSY